MKKIIFPLILLFIMNIGVSYSQINNNKEFQFSEVIKKIETKYEVSITFEADIKYTYSKKSVNIILKETTIEGALNETIKNKDISFTKIRDDYYVLSKKGTSKTDDNNNNNTSVIEKNRTITGTVIDENDLSIPGATVVIKETTNGTITDLDGKFSLKITEDAKTLVISFIGYKEQEILLTETKVYNIQLEQKDHQIDEVIVSGVAGRTERKKLTVSVEKLSEQDLKDVPANSAAGILQGKVPGLTMTEASGSPGSGFSLRLRGSTSLTGDQSPLIIIDGIMVQTNLADINVDDIKSVEIVKGAAASSFYGSKAANGVIVITTKRGADIKNDFQIIVRNEYGISQLTKELDLATHHPYQLADDDANYPYTRYEGIEYDEEGEIISGSRLISENAYADKQYSVVNNHQQAFFKQGQFYTNYAGLSRKMKNSNMFFSFENNKNSGIIFETKGYNRRNFRFNADTKIGKRIYFSTSNLYVNTYTDSPGSSSAFSNVLFMNPEADLFAENSDSTLYNVKPDPYSSIIENPLYPLYHRESFAKRNSFLTNFKLKLNLSKAFNLDLKYTYEKLNKYSRAINNLGYLYMDGAYIDGLLSESNSVNDFKTFQSTLNFIKVINKLTMRAKVSYLFEDEYYYYSSALGRGFAWDDVPHFSNVTQDQSELSSYEQKIRSMNIFGIMDFDFRDRYLLSVLIREDGSSKFGSEERWNMYYRVAAAYRLSEDVAIPGFSELKFRAAIGTAGQRPGYSWQYETYSTNDGVTTKLQKGNKYLKPSETREIEFAIDAEIIKKISITASYSMSETKGAFLNLPMAVHYSNGFPNQWRNAADIKTNVVELSLAYQVFNTKNSHLNFTISYDRVRQEVSEIEGGKYYTGPNDAFIFEKGATIGTIYGYKWLTSLEEMSEQLPEAMTIDDYTINSDGYVIIDGTEGTVDEFPILFDKENDGEPDKVEIGNCNPDFNLNFGTNFYFKGFSLYMLWAWKQGGNIYNYTKQYLFRDGRAGEVDQTGKADADKKSVYYYSSFYYMSYFNSHFVEDGTFIRLREASIYYNLKLKKGSKVENVVKSIKFGLIGRNLLTFTKYTGFDPEVATGSDLTNYSYDSFGYPIFRSFTASIQFTF